MPAAPQSNGLVEIQGTKQKVRGFCCTEHSMAAFYMNQEKLAETGECKYFEEI